MRTLKTLKLGWKGSTTLRLPPSGVTPLARYGASLLRVLYRYDQDTRERLKTVELVV